MHATARGMDHVGTREYTTLRAAYFQAGLVRSGPAATLRPMLPIRRVILYKHGVGYFERSGRVEGDAAIDLSFRAAEMNDVLKSLTTLDLGGGHVASVSYESTKPLEKQLEDIAIRLPDAHAISGLLAEVKGARLAVEIGGTRIAGVVAGIETVRRCHGDDVVESQRLALLIDGATLRSFDLEEVNQLEFLDDTVRRDLAHLLEVLIAAKKKDLKRLTIFAHGEGPREILASYIVETPVWKTSYRILIPEAESDPPLLQGWALVDNTQDEDWEDVELSLVAGLPISFVHDLYSPRYKRRPVVEVEEEEAYAPPLLEAAGGGFAEELDDMELAAMAPVPAGAPEHSAKLHRARAASMRVQTRTAEVGDLFAYEIEKPVTVKRSQSALVPILQSTFAGRKVAIYNPDVRSGNPMSALLFENTTGATLEGGPVTVFDGNTYVGEAMLETLKPGDERHLAYSVELGCAVRVDHHSATEDVERATIADGVLRLHRFQVKRTIYVLTNRTDRDMDLFLDHRFRVGWDLVNTPEPTEHTENFYRFRFPIAARQATDFVVTERGDATETVSLTTVDLEAIGTFVTRRYIDPATETALTELVAARERIAQLDRDLAARQSEIQDIFTNQERLRENLRALGSSQQESSLRQQYVTEMSTDESRLKDLRTAIDAGKSQKTESEHELRHRIGAIRFDREV